MTRDETIANSQRVVEGTAEVIDLVPKKILAKAELGGRKIRAVCQSPDPADVLENSRRVDTKADVHGVEKWGALRNMCC